MRRELVTLVSEDRPIRRAHRVEREPFEERDVVEGRRRAPEQIEDDVFPEAHTQRETIPNRGAER